MIPRRALAWKSSFRFGINPSFIFNHLFPHDQAGEQQAAAPAGRQPYLLPERGEPKPCHRRQDQPATDDNHWPPDKDPGQDVE